MPSKIFEKLIDYEIDFCNLMVRKHSITSAVFIFNDAKILIFHDFPNIYLFFFHRTYIDDHIKRNLVD